MKCAIMSVLIVFLIAVGIVSIAESATQQEVANYVRDNILGGSFGHRTLWMTSTALDDSYVCRDLDPEIADVPFPSGGLWWLVLIDDDPDANWGHACRWLFVNDNLDASTPVVNAEFPPSVWANHGAGPEAGFGCADVTGVPCPVRDVAPSPPNSSMSPTIDNPCLYAILISGGIRDSLNYRTYLFNLAAMKQKLHFDCGFPEDHITTLYKSAVSRDAVGNAIRDLCARLDPNRDILFIYMSNHGRKNPPGLCGWDRNGNGKMDPDEVYTPDQLKADTEGCKVCRLYLVADQCYSGAFVSVADLTRPWMSVYAAAKANQTSYGSEYREGWTGEDPSKLSMDNVHDSIVGMTSDPVRSNNPSGKKKLCECCGPIPVENHTWGRIKVLFR